MDKEIAIIISPLVNDTKAFYSLKQYIDYRIKYYHKQLESAVDEAQMRKYQGAIWELNKFKTLDEEVKNAIRNQTSI